MENYLKLLNEKKNLLLDVLKLTSSSEISHVVDFDPKYAGDSADMLCEEYVSLYESRDNLFNYIKSIDIEISGLPVCNSPEIQRLNSEIKTVAENIIALDKKNKIIAQKLNEYIKNSIRDINIGKKARNIYNYDA